MNKFTIIMPTMWFSHRTDKLLYELFTCEQVGEVIIIDNANNYENQDLKIKTLSEELLSKLVLVPQEQNIFVNPAWNLGVEMAKFDNICLCNDDITFDTNKLFKIVGEALELPNMGIIGQHKQNFHVKHFDHETIVTKSVARLGGWGCMLLFKKRNWIPIPPQLKIFCGDDLLYDFGKHGPYDVKFFLIDGDISTTVKRQEFRAIEQNDIKLYREIKAKRRMKR